MYISSKIIIIASYTNWKYTGIWNYITTTTTKKTDSNWDDQEVHTQRNKI